MSQIPDKQAELNDLIDAVCAGQIDAADMASLNTLLVSDSDAQAYYLQQIDLHNTLRWHATSRATYDSLATLKAAGVQPVAVGPISAQTPDAASPVIASIRPAEIQPAHSLLRTRIGLGIAAMLFIGVILAIAFQSRKQPTTVGPFVNRGPVSPISPNQLALPSLAKLTVLNDAQWESDTVTPDAASRIPAGKLRLRSGMIQLDLANATKVLLQGPAEFDLISAMHGQIHKGKAMVSSPTKASGFTVTTPTATFVDVGADYGISVDQRKRTKATVFQGEIEATIIDRHVGFAQTFHLTRDDGIEVDALGIVTESIINDDARFAQLRNTTQNAAITIANASFEYPRTDDFTKHAAAGWILTAHPVANAAGMKVDAGLVGTRRVGPESKGSTPEAAHGQQWAYLNAKTYPDGRLAHTSIHQAIGTVAQDTTYQLRLTVGHPSAPGRAAAYTVGLYTGTRTSGPATALYVWSNPATPAAGQTAEIKVEYHSPIHTPFRDQVLFIVIQTVPNAKPGVNQILIDNVKIKLLN
jgi:hypothetical protein